MSSSNDQLLINTRELTELADQFSRHCMVLRHMASEIEHCRRIDDDFSYSQRYRRVTEKLDKVARCLDSLSSASNEICEDAVAVSRKVAHMLYEFSHEAHQQGILS